jgi:hypothetical protein
METVVDRPAYGRASLMPASIAIEDRLDPLQFLLWYDDQIVHLVQENDGRTPTTVLAGLFGVKEDTLVRTVYRWREEGEWPPRKKIEDWLDAADIPLEEVYPQFAQDVELEADAFCQRCHEIVTPIKGVCPWCEDPIQKDATGFDRAYCAACKMMSVRTGHGECWRCGAALQRGVPRMPCLCGCGEMISAFDKFGRRLRYVRGHAPRSLETRRDVATEPFAQYLEMRLRTLDPIASLAREHSMSRSDVVAILRRDEATVERELVRRALWCFGTNGRGQQRRPGATSFFELYPDDKRARVCPHCGKSKAPHAEMCKACRKQRDPTYARGGPRSQSKVSDAVLERAKQLLRNGQTMIGVARILLDDTPHKSAESLAQSIRKQLRKEQS